MAPHLCTVFAVLHRAIKRNHGEDHVRPERVRHAGNRKTLQGILLYGGRILPLTDEEWDFVSGMLHGAPGLRGLDCLLHEGNRTLDVGALMEMDPDEIPTVELIMIAALLAYGTLPNLTWAGWDARILELLPSVGRENLEVLTGALLKLAARRENAVLALE